MIQFTDGEAEVRLPSSNLMAFTSDVFLSHNQGIIHLAMGYFIPTIPATALNSLRKTACILGVEAAVQSPSHTNSTVFYWGPTTNLVELSLGTKRGTFTVHLL